jgi:hypothetical protein
MVGVVNAGWDDAPHLSRQEKDRLLTTIPPYQVKARTRGIPMLGSGAIFPIDEDELKCEPFDVPDMMPRAYGFDVGWNWTAAVWMAHDRSNDTIYITDVYKRGQAEPATHIAAIMQRGDWMTGFIDPSAAGAGKSKDGESLLDAYSDSRRPHLNVLPADNTVEAGIWNLYERMTTGRLRVFRHLDLWFEEFRLYRRDDKGRVVKHNDHLMDASRYCAKHVDQWTTKPINARRTTYRGST